MQELDELAGRLWAWRAGQQPRTRDDIPRIDRPDGWLPQVGEAAFDRHRAERDSFAAELAAIDPVEVADRVDHRLLHSALARVTWELDVLGVHHRPRFWVDQAIGPVFDTLLPPGVDVPRVAEVVRLLTAAPQTLAEAPACLRDTCAAPFARSAVAELEGVEDRVRACARALAAIAPELTDALTTAADAAATALGAFRDDLATRLPTLPPAVPVGRRAYAWFLREVACVPMDPEQIRAIGRVEYERAATREAIARNAARGAPEPALPVDAAEQCAREAAGVAAVRAFYEREGLLSQPPALRAYLNLPMPEYLEPLRFLGVTDDLTGPDRLDQDAIAYVPAPGDQLPYFYAANARDPRLGIVHEGAHHQQLALSWANPRPIRRHYYDSDSNEGIAFYNEEMLLDAGLFDDAPHSRAILCNMMRLRALRVEVDVALALGHLDIPAAAELLRTRVPMDEATALEEAAFFAETPGQAITYQIGKTQVLALIADAIRLEGADFQLRRLHDALWLNGNVPIALLRWELLGLTDELAAIGA